MNIYFTVFRTKIFTFFSLLCLLMIACNSDNKKTNIVILSTNFGDIEIMLYDETPLHRDNFLKLVKEGFYEDLLFHRVINGFMIQGGDPESRDADSVKRLGNSGPGYTTAAEITPTLFHKKGALAAARAGDDVNPNKESNGSQFYIVHGRKFTLQELENSKLNVRKLQSYLGQMIQDAKNTELQQEYRNVQITQDRQAIYDFIVSKKELIEQTFDVELNKSLSQEQIDIYTSVGGYYPLDGEYTVFGQVIKGLEIVDKIASVATDQFDRPLENVKMKCSLKNAKNRL